MKERTNQIFVDKDNSQNEFKFDIYRIIEELNKLPFDFYISGGVICQYFLDEHRRYVKDIDIVTKCDLKDVERIFRKHFNVVEFAFSPITDLYYEEAFICLIEIDGKIIQIDGMRVEFFDEIKPEIYKVNDLSFKGVSIEYLVATKILAVTCKIERPIKHLIDVFSFSLLDPLLLDKQEIKRCMMLFNDYENNVRKTFKKQQNNLNFYIEEDKPFSGPIVFTALQAGHNVSKETMIEEVNKWLSTFKD